MAPLTLPFAVSAFLLVLPGLKCDTTPSSATTQKQIECYSQNKIYHPGRDKCFKLLTRGPCDPGSWFVLEKPKSTGRNGTDGDPVISAICVREKCPEGGYYWVKTGTCVQPKDRKRLCGVSADRELLNNVFGEGECRCSRVPPRVQMAGQETGKCYQLYTRGPCKQGEVVGFQATCIRDRCHEEAQRLRSKGQLSRYGVLAPWTNGSCYELGTQGPCPDTVVFKVHELTRKPDCVTLTNAIFDLEKPQNCFQDENGDCQKTIRKSENADRYKEELLSALNSARKKRGFRFP